MNVINPTRIAMQRIAWFFIVLMINQLFFPVAALALTAGPSQPEVKSFEPAGTTEMVNLFSGDFTYNIPLLEVPGPDGGYPINLFYNSVTSMEQEASWTGLGWNINVGSLSRGMRGLPDDFDGEKIGRKLDMRKSETTTVGGIASLEIAGFDAASLGLSFGINYVYNSYKGAGFSIDPNLSLGIGGGSGGFSYGANLNLGFSASTIDAGSANVGFSLGAGGIGGNNPNAGVNISFDAKGNHDYALSIGGVIPNILPTKDGRTTSTGTVSFAKRSYTPAVTMPWSGTNFIWDLNFTPGGTVVYGKFGVNGSYSEQYIEDGGIPQSKPAYGYNYLQNSTREGLLDFNREKDGSVHRYKRYLATPIMTHDVYNVSGQGIGGAFRAHRSDYGFLADPYLKSSAIGGRFGGEGGVFVEFGLSGAVNFRDEVNNNWPYIDWIKFKGEELDNSFEPVYYKMAGDVSAEKATTYDYLGEGEARDKPLRLKREGFDYNRWNGGELEAEETNTGNAWLNNGSYNTKVTWNQDKNHRTERKPRNTSVQPITNKLLRNSNSEELLPEFDVKYYDAVTNPNVLNNYETAPSSEVTRPDNNQNAAFTVLGQDGVRWNYGLPVYNHEQKDAKFSVAPVTCTKRVDINMKDNDRNNIDYIPSNDNLRSNDMIDEQQIPSYVHTHLLTSVLGTDYGDIDGIAGPSDGDVGYWMKTNYVKLSSDYQWRAPFVGCNYAEGYENSPKDDIGAFMWGKRDVYLPATVETKTHIAYFEVSKRYDARGAKHYIQNASDLGADAYGEYSYKLDKVKLYSKADIKANNGVVNTTPLKTVHFTYDYSLCNNVENYNTGTAASDNTNLWGGASPILGGKLTLKSVHFTYEKNSRGALSPYVFDYSALNPDYDDTKIDRWGMYRTNFLQSGYDLCDNMKLPYTDQTPSRKAQLDQDIAAWHLEKIHMPSGSVLNIKMERDDYAYVQDAQATRMFKINSTSEGHPVNSVTTDLAMGGDPQPIDRVIQFELEKPTNSTTELEKYIEDLPVVSRHGVDYKQLTYRIRVDLRNTNNPTEEYVGGYCEIDKDGNGDDLIYFEPTSTNGSGEYTHANIVLKNSRIRAKGKTHHPMVMTSWKFLKDNLPDKMLAADLGGPPDAITSLDQIGENINAIFTGFYKYCSNNNFAQIIDLDRSYIRLNSPDRIQYGDGIRVKEISLDDNWAATSSETSTLGVAYDYTTEDKESGEIYSSGVMENEIMIGYDECALRWAVLQEELKDGVVRDVHKYEYPMNEGYHPGASVGYSKVTVRSLASNYALLEQQGETIPSDLAGQSYSTTGQTVYEYYTAKDFPIVTRRTSLDDTETNPWATMLLDALLNTRLDHYTGTQGYSIELNNMHGKTRQITTYGQLSNGKMDDKPLTQVEYRYKTKKVSDFRRGKFSQEITVLDNEVEVLVSDSPTAESATTETQLLGVDYEFFIEGREALQTAGSGGLDFNFDYVPLWFVLPFPWPSYKYSENKARTSVSNKIIVRSGVLESVHAFDGQAHIVTKNKVFDAQTGSPVLATVENQLEGEIYNYSIPAYMAHSSMGAAADNWGYNTLFYFDGTPDNCTGYYSSLAPVNVSDLMVPGDEFIAVIEEKPAIPQGPYQKIGKTRVIYMGQLYNSSGVRVPQFDILDNTGLAGKTELRAIAKNTRSGNRNLVGATIAQYSTVDTDPNNPSANPLSNRFTSTATPNLMDITINGTVANIAPTTSTIAQIDQMFLNNVLSASAADFSDDWTMEHYDYRTNVSNINPYISGLKGVWKARSSYAYVDERNQENLTLSENEVDIRTSGVVDNVVLFNWENPFREYIATSRWIRTQDITKYRLGGQSVESRDVLGNYQAALYGYDDNLVTAQGVNTTYYEFGYEGFEETPINSDYDIGIAATNGVINNGNIDIIPKDPNSSITSIERHENYRLTYPMKKPNGSNISYVLVRKSYSSVPVIPTNLKASLVLNNGSTQHRVDVAVKKKYPLSLGTGMRYKVPGLTNLIDENTKGEYTVYELDFSDACDLKALRTDWWAGDITLKYSMPISTHENNLLDKITDEQAHTGNYSLRVAHNNGNGHFSSYTQNILRLQHNKKYVFSAWIAVPVDGSGPLLVTPTYKNGIRGVNIGGILIEPEGPIIEGWQRVEGTFTHNANNGTPTMEIIGGDNDLYIDDIRIFPADGNMVSYVYNPVNYKLQATLDDNNYATFYIYDESGSLISTKRETERGIISIQESRSYVEPTK
ncbi:hypothetical protein [Aureispira sp. CCB-E]|uniref:hypothetical protein n=1 Tax=Aureispira sp. CCB-E TaxID=3051121 RepID=UPI0028685E76|nr:hypothetical protein [Aureispira sp. CCB-E]WMX17579.1 hypothetical protein QP953_28260 [Aureispira sp. CCB-E]